MIQPFAECWLPLETHCEMVAFDDRLATLLSTGEFYCGGTEWTSSVDPDGRFIWAFPVSEADRRNGGVCPISGFWAAGHAMRTVGGVKYIAEFAPDKVHEEDD